MNEYTVILVISNLVTLFFTLAKPMSNVSKTITKLDTKFEIEIPALGKSLTDAIQAFQESNEKIWEHIQEYTPRIVHSEQKIVILEKEVDELGKKVEKLNNKVARLETKTEKGN